MSFLVANVFFFILIVISTFSASLCQPVTDYNEVDDQCDQAKNDEYYSFIQRQVERLTDDLARQKAKTENLERQVEELEKQKANTERPELATRCPDNFVYDPSVKSCYRVVREQLSWANASQRCNSYRSDAHLAVVDNAAKQQAIENLLRPIGRPTECLKYGWTASTDYQVWLAGQRVNPNAETPFVWKISSDGGQKTYTSHMEFTNWNNGEPNFVGGSESCLATVYGFNYKWNDVACSHEFCSVCETGDID